MCPHTSLARHVELSCLIPIPYRKREMSCFLTSALEVKQSSKERELSWSTRLACIRQLGTLEAEIGVEMDAFECKSGSFIGGGAHLERNTDLDGDGGVDLKAASSIYFVETRVRVQDVVVRLFPFPLFLFTCPN